MISFKLSKAVGIISRLKYPLPSSILRRLYYCFFHPHLLYDMIIWSATYRSYLKPIEILQDKAFRIVNNCQRNHKASSLHRKLTILNVD